MIASHNPGKCAELEQLLRGHVAEVLFASALNLPVPDETAPSFAGNARLKAVAICAAQQQHSDLPALR